MNREAQIASKISGSYGPYTPEHVKQGPPRVSRSSGTTVIRCSDERVVDERLWKKIVALAGSDDIAVFVKVDWSGIAENSLETGYGDWFTIKNYRIMNVWYEKDHMKTVIPRGMWNEFDKGGLEDVLQEKFEDSGTIPRKIEASVSKEFTANKEWLTTEDVREICPACADKMTAKGICRVKASVFKNADYPETPPTEEDRKEWREEGEQRRKEEGIKPRKSSLETFAQIRARMGSGHQHHLRLNCVSCGGVETCRCSAPKEEVSGLCYDCCEKDGIDFETGMSRKIAFETLEDKIIARQIRKYLLHIADFVFSHKPSSQTMTVEVSSREIEELKRTVQRALQLT